MMGSSIRHFKIQSCFFPWSAFTSAATKPEGWLSTLNHTPRSHVLPMQASEHVLGSQPGCSAAQVDVKRLGLGFGNAESTPKGNSKEWILKCLLGEPVLSRPVGWATLSTLAGNRNRSSLGSHRRPRSELEARRCRLCIFHQNLARVLLPTQAPSLVCRRSHSGCARQALRRPRAPRCAAMAEAAAPALPPTSLLFFADTYLLSGRARVLRCEEDADGRVDMVLDQTLFYPQGGGQVRFCRYRFCATAELKYRGAVGWETGPLYPYC
jgi:hypothetical protein